MAKTVENLQDMLEYALDYVKSTYDGSELMPAWIGQTPDGEMIYIASPWANNVEKRAAVRVVADLFRKHGVIRYANITEAWTLDVSKRLPADYTPGDSIEARPDRIEVVTVIVADATDALGRILRIIRDGDKATLGEPSDLGEVAGMMCRLLGHDPPSDEEIMAKAKRRQEESDGEEREQEPRHTH